MHPGTRTFVTAAVVTGLAAVLVFSRMYSRFVLIKHAGVEDYLIVLAFLFSVGLTTVIGLGELRNTNPMVPSSNSVLDRGQEWLWRAYCGFDPTSFRYDIQG